MEVDIGRRIKEIRKSQKITLKAMSEATGLSESYISQVERGVCAASVSSLAKIAESLKTNPEVFLSDEPSIQSALQENTYVCPAGVSYYYKVLSVGGGGRRIVCRQVTMLPHRETEIFPLEKRGFLYILSGYMDIDLNGAREQLFPGDSLYYDETMKMNCRNRSPYLMTFLYVTYLEADGEEAVCRES